MSTVIGKLARTLSEHLIKVNQTNLEGKKDCEVRTSARPPRDRDT